ncbi:MAG TPA: aconitate hydratase, partial [Methylomirabilota bacterium]|nr:aconitate hydratase [Methylomirabilota bacterium]
MTLKDTCRIEADLGAAGKGAVYSLKKLEESGAGKISRLPISIRVVLESLLRNCDGATVTEEHVRDLARWQPNGPRSTEIPFIVGRVVLNCMAGIPLLGDLTAMRGAITRKGRLPAEVKPQVPVD